MSGTRQLAIADATGIVIALTLSGCNTRGDLNIDN